MACCRPKGDCHGLGRYFPVVFHVYRLMVFGGQGFEHKARRRRETLAEIHDEPEVEREEFGSSFLVRVGVQYAFHQGGRVSLLPAIDFDFVNRPREGRDADRLRREDRLQLLMKSRYGTSRLSRDRRDAPQSLSRHPSVQTERALRRISLGRTSVDYPVERGPVRSRFGKTIQVPRRRLESAAAAGTRRSGRDWRVCGREEVAGLADFGYSPFGTRATMRGEGTSRAFEGGEGASLSAGSVEPVPGPAGPGTPTWEGKKHGKTQEVSL